jgi:predicted RNase H-like HicB family nuclease
MQILIVIIEKDGDNYIGRSPNLLGVSITTKTRDEAETAILDAMEKRINELYGTHSGRKTISRLPIDESIGCVYNFTDEWRKGDECGFSAQKDGLCWVHWKKLYSHAFGSEINLKACPLCGESDKEILKNWQSPCPVKIENPDWIDLLEEKKRTMKAEWKKERLEVRLENLGNQPRCTKMLSNGEQCYKEQYRRGLCFSHCWKEEETPRKGNPPSQSQQNNSSNYFKNRFRNKE